MPKPKKWNVYAIYTASKHLGEFESDTKEEAIEKAEEDGDVFVNICHQCADEIEVGDAYEYQAEEKE